MVEKTGQSQRTRNIFSGLVATLFLTSWGRAGLYHWSRAEVQELSRTSSMVAENNRGFVAASHDVLNILWIAAPVMILVLLLVTLYLGIGHFVLIGISALVGAVLFATGVFFPTTIMLRVLAVLFMVVLVSVVYLTVVKADQITNVSGDHR